MSVASHSSSKMRHFGRFRVGFGLVNAPSLDKIALLPSPGLTGATTKSEPRMKRAVTGAHSV
jgi:hypothetical protein